jgi:hypothetical protein
VALSGIAILLGAALLLSGCADAPPAYLTEPPHELDEEGRAYAFFARRYDEERIRRGGVHCEPYIPGNGRMETKRIALDKAKNQVGNPPIEYQSTGIVRLIRTWYCALAVPSQP